MQASEILLTIKLQQQIFVDPKRITLLKAIQQCGSISQAAKNANVSYKSAWDHLEAMNALSPKPLLARNIGGKNGGGTVLTAYAERLLKLYELLQQTQQKAFEILQDESIPLENLLQATAQFSPQSSARNQFFGNVVKLIYQDVHCFVEIDVTDFPQKITACITAQSAKRLELDVGKAVMAMIKAPWVELHLNATPTAMPATVANISESGGVQEITLAITPQIECYATAQNLHLTQGQSVWVSFDPKQMILVAL